ncbi:MAG: hypothetical protein PUP92_18440 [Rhizonema sp. PD38]|nr:hypothetical protein [Rhizonema sp. PD38]
MLRQRYLKNLRSFSKGKCQYIDYFNFAYHSAKLPEWQLIREKLSLGIDIFSVAEAEPDSAFLQLSRSARI